MGTRLNKYLALCGLGSRRSVEGLVSSGRVAINGKKTFKIGTIVEAGDQVAVDSKPVSPIEDYRYIILYKPRGYITTMHDERNRPTVMDLVPEKFKRRGVYPVGRLDRDTSGLLILTNDGDFAYRLTKPKFDIPKEYIIELSAPLETSDMSRIAKGVYIPQLEIKTRPCKIDLLDDSCKRVRVIITEGKNRQIRYTFSNLGYTVKSLERTGYGNLTLRGLSKGAHRTLSGPELQSLRKLAGL